jgi:hypothetical protein
VKENQQHTTKESLMFTSVYQKILGAIKQCFEIARFPDEPTPIPIKVQPHESAHHRPMSAREYRLLNQKRRR